MTFEEAKAAIVTGHDVSREQAVLNNKAIDAMIASGRLELPGDVVCVHFGAENEPADPVEDKFDALGFAMASARDNTPERQPSVLSFEGSVDFEFENLKLISHGMTHVRQGADGREIEFHYSVSGVTLTAEKMDKFNAAIAELLS